LLKETAADEDKAAFLKKIVFERLNSGGVKLSPQETRNAVYGGPLNLLCLRLSENDWFRRMWGIPSQVGEISQDDDGGEGDSNDLDPPPGTSAGTRMFEKMEDVELILRFFAYRHIQKSNAGLNRISSFLDDFLRTGNRYPKSIPNDYERLLARTINFLFESCPATSGIDPSTTRGTDPPPFVFPRRQAMFLRSAEKGRFFIPACPRRSGCRAGRARRSASAGSTWQSDDHARSSKASADRRLAAGASPWLTRPGAVTRAPS
jgi:hypothetical protein